VNAALSKGTVLFAEGVQAHRDAVSLAVKCKLSILDAGRKFRAAKDWIDFGDWEKSCKAAQISSDTVNRYIEFVTLAEEWAQKEMPGLHGAKLDSFVDGMVLKSPKTYTALLRSWSLVEQEGAYDPGAYRQAKVAGPAQLTFHYERADLELRAIIEVPEYLRKLERSSLEKLRDRTQSALAAMNEALNEVEVPA
jgi:hypothetical protein